MLIMKPINSFIHVPSELLNQNNYTLKNKTSYAVCSLSLLSAAIAAAMEGAKCLNVSLSLSSLSPNGDALDANRDSTSLSVKNGWSWFLAFPVMKEEFSLLLFSLCMLSSTVSLTYKDPKRVRRKYLDIS